MNGRCRILLRIRHGSGYRQCTCRLCGESRSVRPWTQPNWGGCVTVHAYTPRVAYTPRAIKTILTKDFNDKQGGCHVFTHVHLSLLPASNSVRCSPNRARAVQTRFYRWGGCLARDARTFLAEGHARGSCRSRASHRVREFPAFRWNIEKTARRASPPCRGQSYQVYRDWRPDGTGWRADNRLRRTSDDAGSD